MNEKNDKTDKDDARGKLKSTIGESSPPPARSSRKYNKRKSNKHAKRQSLTNLTPDGKSLAPDGKSSAGEHGLHLGSATSGSSGYLPPAKSSNEVSVNEDNAKQVGPAKEILEKQGYEIIALLGKGGYANVWKVKKGNNKIRAAKIIYMSKTSDNYHTKFLPRELKILSQINHKNIITVHEIQQIKRHGFIVIMEYAPGGTLTDVMKREGVLPEERVKFLMVNVFRGLNYMHSLFFAHRDLKLDNVLIDKNGIPKLTDFSYVIYCKEKDGTKILSKTFCGTEPYLSPEIVRNESYNPMAADVWSVGVCLFILINRKFPFPLDDSDKMLVCQLRRSYTYKDRPEGTAPLSDNIKNLVYIMLDPDATQRATMAKVMVHPWVTSYHDPSTSV